MKQIPPNFEEHPATGPFSTVVGPFYVRTAGSGYVTGMRVEERHCNRALNLHGAMLSMLFDTAFAHAARQQYDPAIGIVTSHLAVDFTGKASVGDWIEAHIEVVRAARNIAFLNGLALNEDKRIGSAIAHFLTVDRTKRPLVR